MTDYLSVAIDLAAIAALVFGVYLPRHRRTDMALAYLTVNLGVLAVAFALASTSVAAGVGLGLFGVLSIIRLRSEELTQREIAYYFASLAIGLVTGLGTTSVMAMILVAAIVVAIAVMDAAWLQRGERRLMVLDRAFTDESELRAHVAALCDAEVLDVAVEKVDLVADSTLVRVRLGAHSDRRGRVVLGAAA